MPHARPLDWKGLPLDYCLESENPLDNRPPSSNPLSWDREGRHRRKRVFSLRATELPSIRAR
jgi:hypothetical protein